MMQPQRSVGIQWKLSLTQLAIAALGSLTVAASHLLLRRVDLAEGNAIAVALALGLLVSLAGSSVSLRLARSIKLRLWELGDLADRIGRGDFGRRLTPGPADELGTLEEQLNAMASRLLGNMPACLSTM